MDEPSATNGQRQECVAVDDVVNHATRITNIRGRKSIAIDQARNDLSNIYRCSDWIDDKIARPINGTLVATCADSEQ